MEGIDFRVSEPVDGAALNALFATAWEGYGDYDVAPVLRRSLAWVCAYDGHRLVGFVNLAWDGGAHAFILDTVVAPDRKRRGIGTGLVRSALDAARAAGVEWVHVDYEPHLDAFYRECGFRPTAAGVLNLLRAEG
ncbi:GNAT family N-acetyltransferase [Longimicrobium sp.]|uniref:GNAT family N-acetyltransferase n=1 Tax=Longimicrobium sp. TaxID=2029185 RepID=UPI002D10DB26|nr:GNAT family N-acetyltransferase [Longimicrobium sp.]HSU17857.1 GNAT family N-acetyltransferase [Longimicrobium sp.]